MQTPSVTVSAAPTRLGQAMLLGGLAALLIPSYIEVYQVFWRVERGAQGPIMLAIVLALVWRERAVLRRWAMHGRPLPGAMLVAGGLLAHVLARSQSIYSLEIAAQIPVLLGIVWLSWGR